MIVNYKTLLFGEEAAETLGQTPESARRRDILTYTDVCCPEMSDYLTKPTFDHTPRFDLGYELVPHYLRVSVARPYIPEWHIRYCPFCGKKVEFNEIALSTQVRTKTPPTTITHYVYEEKTLKAPDIQVTT